MAEEACGKKQENENHSTTKDRKLHEADCEVFLFV
jgi:hypothetical protein